MDEIICTANHKNIWLKSMNSTHEHLLLQWQSEAGNRNYSRKAAIPTKAEHKKWFLNSLNDSGRRMWVVLFKGEECGYVRLDDLGDSEEVSVLISKKFQGLGLAYAAIDSLKLITLYKKIDAEVVAENKASCLLFEKLKFGKLSNNRYQWIKS